MTKVRKHRGTLTESMETVFEVEDFDHLVDAINKEPFAPVQGAFGCRFVVSPEQVHVEPYYGWDGRIGWDTYLVSIDGYGVWGMTNGPLKP